MFCVKTWICYDRWPYHPNPRGNFYVMDDPKNEAIMRKLMNSSEDGFSHIFSGFVEVTYNGQEILGEAMFSSVIGSVWWTYEELLKQTYEKGYAIVPHPESPTTGIFCYTSYCNPSQLKLILFPEAKESSETFTLPKKEFMKAMYDGLIAYHKSYLMYCEDDEIKRDMETYIEDLLKNPLW